MPLVFVLSGPGGVGKGTIVSRLLRDDPSIWLSRSWTTRARRPGEAEDAYHFVTPERFQRHIDDGGFLEWVQFLDYRQGTPLPDTPPDVDVVLFEIDVEGAHAIRQHYPDAILVFLDAPDLDEQEGRLRGRGDDEATVRRRLEKGEQERRRAAEIGMRTVVNDDLDRAVAEIRDLLQANRSSPPQPPTR